jgi:hypothetical protein
LNKSDAVPQTVDVVKLAVSLAIEVEKNLKAFLKKPGRENGRKLSEATLTQIIVFNKRRGGEASRLKVDTYLEVKKKSQELEFNEELFSSLTEEEKVLAKSHLLVRTIGKCGTHVPIILTRKMKTAVDALVADREILGFSDSNPFIFGIPGRDTHLKAWTILNAFCQKFQTAGITSTSLRKYLATTAQALDLGEQQIGWIAHHMGHSKEVHTFQNVMLML